MRIKTIETIKDMRRLYEAGWSLQQIGDRFGLTRQAVQQRFMRAGIARRPNTSYRVKIDGEELRRLYVDERYRQTELARHFGTSGDTIGKALRIHGITIRPRGFDKCKYPELYTLGLGESLVIGRPPVSSPHRHLYQKATSYGIRIRIKSQDKSTFLVTRVN